MEAGDAEVVTEEAMLEMPSLVSGVGHEVPVSKEGYVEFVRSLAGELQSGCLECEASTQQLAELNSKIEELKLKDRLLVDVDGHVGKTQRPLNARRGGFKLTKQALETKEAVL